MRIEIVLFVLLAVCAIFDVVKKEIPLVVVWSGIFLAVIWNIFGKTDGQERIWADTILSVLPGTVFWAISLVTKEKVGYGDGWILIMIGLFTGLERCFMILLVGLMLESAAVLVLLAVRRITTDRMVPFAPFLLLGMGVVIWL